MSQVQVYITYIIYLISGLSVSPQRCDNPILATLASTCHKGFVFGRLVCTYIAFNSLGRHQMFDEEKCLRLSNLFS